MSGQTLTGRRRHRLERKCWGRDRLILQVEVRFLHTYCVGGHIDSEWVTTWRDAKATDLTIEEKGAA